ncbi:MAG: Hsp20 family protein [Labilithrix sp.]|nr:Hsp20 family protein [Labilithrix sp.]
MDAERERGPRQKERRSSRRRVTLPRGADAAQLDARFDGGELTIRVPKLAHARRRVVPVRVNGQRPSSAVLRARRDPPGAMRRTAVDEAVASALTSPGADLHVRTARDSHGLLVDRSPGGLDRSRRTELVRPRERAPARTARCEHEGLASPRARAQARDREVARPPAGSARAERRPRGDRTARGGDAAPPDQDGPQPLVGPRDVFSDLLGRDRSEPAAGRDRPRIEGADVLAELESHGAGA